MCQKTAAFPLTLHSYCRLLSNPTLDDKPNKRLLFLAERWSSFHGRRRRNAAIARSFPSLPGGQWPWPFDLHCNRFHPSIHSVIPILTLFKPSSSITSSSFFFFFLPIWNFFLKLFGKVETQFRSLCWRGWSRGEMQTRKSAMVDWVLFSSTSYSNCWF